MPIAGVLLLKFIYLIQDYEDETLGNILLYSAGHNQTIVVEKLSPYTLYRVRLRTCLNEDDNECVVGDDTMARTLPAAPEEQPAPVLNAAGPRVVDISWSHPGTLNGKLNQYQVMYLLYFVAFLSTDISEG